MFEKDNTYFGSKQTSNEVPFVILCSKKEIYHQQILRVIFSPNICWIPNQGHPLGRHLLERTLHLTSFCRA